MRRALGVLLLSTRKVRAERSTLLYQQAHYRTHIGHHELHDPPHIPRTRFCYVSAPAASSHTDPHVATFTASTRPTLSPSSFHPTKIHAEKYFSRAVAQCNENVAAEGFSHGVNSSTKDTAPEDLYHGVAPQDLSTQEAQKLLKLVNVEDFKKHLLGTGKHCMPLEDVTSLCKQTGTAISDAEAEEIVKILDEAGTILIFRRKVFLEPRKVAEVLSRAMPLPLAQEDDPRNKEFSRLQKEKEEIDSIAHKQVRNMLWGALGALLAQSVIFFRLTFWDLSWDVMEPIAFFVTSSSLLAGFSFFVITKRDPSYHDFMDTLFSSKQRKLMKKRNFDIERFKELQVMCCLPTSSHYSRIELNLNHTS